MRRNAFEKAIYLRSLYFKHVSFQDFKPEVNLIYIPEMSLYVA